ncbi:MAG: hypothetical protein KGL10_00145 [Alphaproteobacteria bacterium]|nr:hypothetical protein [Alphaproteobacteria bacterium]
MDIVSAVAKFLPAEAQDKVSKVTAVLNDPKVRKYLEDKEVANDIQVIAAEAVKTINAVGGAHPDKDLSAAFNTAAGMVPLATTFILKGKLGMLDAASALKKASSIPSMLDAFRKAAARKDPIVFKIGEAMESNQTAVEAAVRIAVKTNGDLFRLEKDAAGQGYVVDLTTGSGMKFPIEKAIYDDAVARLAAAKKNNPKGPSV